MAFPGTWGEFASTQCMGNWSYPPPGSPAMGQSGWIRHSCSQGCQLWLMSRTGGIYMTLHTLCVMQNTRSSGPASALMHPNCRDEGDTHRSSSWPQTAELRPGHTGHLTWMPEPSLFPTPCCSMFHCVSRGNFYCNGTLKVGQIKILWSLRIMGEAKEDKKKCGLWLQGPLMRVNT